MISPYYCLVNLRKIKYLLCLLGLLMANVGAIYAQLLSGDCSSINAQVKNQSIYFIYQDTNGFLWFGTDQGCVKYDGSKIKQYKVEDGLGDNNILRIYGDLQNRIWFLPFNGNLSFYKEGKIYNSKNYEGLDLGFEPRGMVNFIEDKNRNIWIGSMSSDLIRIDSNFHVSKIKLDSLHQTVFIHLLSDSVLQVFHGHNVYVMNIQESSLKLNFKEHISSPLLVGSNLNDGTTYVLSRKGIYHLFRDKSTLIIDSVKIPIKNAYYFLYPHNNELWLGGSNNSIFHYVKNLDDDRYLFMDSLVLEKIPIHIAIDYNNNMWYSTAKKGIYKISKNNKLKIITSFKPDRNLENITCSVFGDSAFIYFGTDMSRVYKYNYKTQLIEQSWNLGIGTNPILGLYHSNKKELYINALNNVWYIDNTSKVKMVGCDINNNISVKSFYELSNGNILLPAYNGVYQITDGDKCKQINKCTNLQSGVRTYCIAQFNDQLWSENKERIVISSINNKIKELPQFDALFKSRINSIKPYDKRHIIISCTGNGFSILRDEKIIKTYNTTSGLLSNGTKQLFVVDSTIIQVSDLGLSIIRNPISQKPFIKNYPNAACFDLDDIRDVLLENSRILLLTSNSLYSLDLEDSYAVRAPDIKFFISRITIDQTEVNTANKIELTHNYKLLNIEFQVISYLEPQLVDYRYRINNNAWINTTEDLISLPFLEPAEYRIEVQARQYNSSWTASQVVKFEVLTPIYKRWWFVMILILGLCAILYKVFSYYSSLQYRAKLQELDKKHALNEERHRISSEMHDDLGVDITNIILQSANAGKRTSDSLSKNSFNQLHHSAQMLLEKTQEIIWALNPSNDSFEDLLGFVQKYIHDLGDTTDVNIKLVRPSTKFDISLGAVYRKTIFLVIKELINNALKHSMCDEINIIIKIENKLILHVEIVDNGIGINDHANFNILGNGLRNIKKRISQLKGIVEIYKLNDRGTKAMFQLQLHSK